MFVIENDNTFYFDVDDTLILWEGTTYKPHYKHIELMKRAHLRGQPIVVWSAGGHAFAARIVRELGLEEYVTICICKPKWWVEDLTAEQVLLSTGKIWIKDE